MTLERTFVAAAFLTATASLVGLGALAAGAVEPSGTATAGERSVAAVATVLGIVAGVALLVMTAGQPRVLGQAATALAALLAALAFSVPAVLAFAYRTSTPADDSTGCGSLSTPTTVFLPGKAGFGLTDTCVTRLRQQEAIVAVLAIPTAVSAGFGLTVGLRSPRKPD